MKQLFFIVLIFILLSCKEESFEIEGATEDFILRSSGIEQDFRIYTFLPPSYPKEGTVYPLIIGLDADAEFSNMAGIVSNHIKRGVLPPAVFVGIGYVGGDSDETHRNRDYTPTATVGIEDGTTGGASTFYDFIRMELIPELEERYQVDTSNSKTLMGHSYGGLFTLFAMFQERSTNPFDKFIPAGSSFWYDDGVIFEFENDYFQSNDDLQVKVYTTIGSLEGGVMLASFEEMNETIKSRNYPGMIYKSELLSKYGHSRSDYISFDRGLAYVFNH